MRTIFATLDARALASPAGALYIEARASIAFFDVWPDPLPASRPGGDQMDPEIDGHSTATSRNAVASLSVPPGPRAQHCCARLLRVGWHRVVAARLRLGQVTREGVLQ